MKCTLSKGSTRFVFVFRYFVLKIPRLSSWVHFIRGVYCNLVEDFWYKNNCGEPLGHVYLSLGGFLLVMKKYEIATSNETFYSKLQDLKGKSKFHRDFWDSDNKPENFGYDESGNLIKIDYGD